MFLIIEYPGVAPRSFATPGYESVALRAASPGLSENRKEKNLIAELLYSNKAFEFNSRLKKVKNEKRKVKNPIAELFYCNKAFDFNS